MGEDIFSGLTFPSPIKSVFDKVISIGWYDGTTSGVALDSRHSMAFRFDLLDFGPGQEVRVFALARLDLSAFNQIAELLSSFCKLSGQVAFVRWPSVLAEGQRLSLEMDAILAHSGKPEFAIATNSMFENLLAAKPLTEAARELLPAEFHDLPIGDFNFWQTFLELPA